MRRAAGRPSVGSPARRSSKKGLNKSEQGMRWLVIRACPPPYSSHPICSPRVQCAASFCFRRRAAQRGAAWRSGLLVLLLLLHVDWHQMRS